MPSSGAPKGSPRLRLAWARRVGRRIERPPAHWSVLFLVILLVLLLLLANGLSTHGTGSSQTPTEVGGGGLKPGETILEARGGHLRPVATLPRRRVALTFDDGPDPKWTPRIAAVLERFDAPATFFVVGQRVTENADIIRRLDAQGLELGNHTFGHADVSAVPSWRRDLELSLTDTAVAGAAGVRLRLFRPPYSADPTQVTEAQVQGLDAVAQRGYTIALSDFDSEDWRSPGVEAIVRNATPPGRRGGVILMHDGGGDRGETVQALEELIPHLRSRGFKIVPLSRLVSAPSGALEPAASSSERLRGQLFLGALKVSHVVAGAISAVLIPIALAAILRAIAVTWFSLHHARARRRRDETEFTPPVSVIVPAFNEAKLIERAVRSLAGGDYPEHEVIVVDDGSDDGTAGLVEAMELPGVTVVRQANRGKAAALNRGLELARHEIVVMVDADTVFENTTLRRLVRPFRRPEVGAVAGNTKVGNRRGLLGTWQHIDYVTGFNLDRRLYDVLRCMPTVPGAIGGFRREAIDEAGWLSHATLAEDTDLTIAIGRRGWDVVYVEDARAHTEAPPTFAGLWRQRYRWSYGTMQAVWKHRAALVRREPGKVGRRGLPYLVLFQILLPALAPLIDVFTIYGLLFLDPAPVLGYWLGFNLLMLALAVLAFRLDGEPMRPLWLMPAQQFVYRQLMYLVVIQSLISALRGVRLRWQHVERSGDLETAPSPQGLTGPP